MPRTDRNGTPYRWAVCASAADSMSVAMAAGNARADPVDAAGVDERVAGQDGAGQDAQVDRRGHGGVVQDLLGLVHLGHARHLPQLVPERPRVRAGVEVLRADDDVTDADVQPDAARAAGADDGPRVRALDGDGGGRGGVHQADPALHQQHLTAADGEQAVLGVTHLRGVPDDVGTREERRRLVGHRGDDDRVDGDHAVT